MSDKSIGKFPYEQPETPFRVTVYEQLPSTNSTVRELAEQGAPEWTVVIANSQTAGRGRMGRTFYSPAGTGLYMSVLLRPKLPAADALLITTAAAVSVAEAIERICAVRTQIKWVNDVLVGERKICGILTESSLSMEDGMLHYAVLGIGVNLRAPAGGFPAELRDIAGAATGDIAGTATGDGAGALSDLRNRVAAAVLERFAGYYRSLPERTFFDGYRQRLAWMGCPVTVTEGNRVYRAVVEDLDPSFALILRTEDGSLRRLTSGQIRP